MKRHDVFCRKCKSWFLVTGPFHKLWRQDGNGNPTDCRKCGGPILVFETALCLRISDERKIRISRSQKPYGARNKGDPIMKMQMKDGFIGFPIKEDREIPNMIQVDDNSVVSYNPEHVAKVAKMRRMSFDDALAHQIASLVAMPFEIALDDEWKRKTGK